MKLKFFRTRVRDSHQGCQAAACTGSALSKFCLSVGEGATYRVAYPSCHPVCVTNFWSSLNYLSQIFFIQISFHNFFITIFFYHKKCSFIIFSCQSFSGDIFTSNYCHCCQFCHYCHNYYHRYSLPTKIGNPLTKKSCNLFAKKNMQPPEKKSCNLRGG